MGYSTGGNLTKILNSEILDVEVFKFFKISDVAMIAVAANT
jgi:hypothetical protein